MTAPRLIAYVVRFVATADPAARLLGWLVGATAFVHGLVEVMRRLP